MANEKKETTTMSPRLRILAIDCCEHILVTLRNLPDTQLLSRASKESRDFGEPPELGLIIVGVAQYPIRRFFITQLRRVYPNVPVLLLRREQVRPEETLELIRGEFLLTDQGNSHDCEMIHSLRRILPFEPCDHLSRGRDYDVIRELMEMLSKTFSDPGLTLTKTAQNIHISPKRLSIILNNHVGVGFRELLRNLRIEEAKRMLRTRSYSVKEVAVRVGFTNSHYFSRSFKEMTGHNASEYIERSAVLN
jgi:AraC-like DNA-binding protein